MESGLSRVRHYLPAVAIVAAVIMVVPSGVRAQPPNERLVMVLRAADNDHGPAVASEAIAFWNRVLTELQLGTRLVETELIVTSQSERIFENYTRALWQQAGRLSPGSRGPKEPHDLKRLGADVVVFLSRQPTMSFAWPLRQSPSFFVAVPSQTVTRNIIAHELGHALGLKHQNNPGVLMCSPCQEDQVIDTASFLPLTRYDRLRLRELHLVAP
mgnify:FL=1